MAVTRERERERERRAMAMRAAFSGRDASREAPHKKIPEERRGYSTG
jgi:hypothetical protein